MQRSWKWQDRLTRRRLLGHAAGLGALALARKLLPAYAWADSARTVRNGPVDLSIDTLAFEVDGNRGTAVAINGTVPGPLIRLKEGEEAVIRVTNRLDETTSIHWHGLLVPPEMDGVPGVSFFGIKAKETFQYRFPVRQSGTYWYHSHSGGQEQMGMYGPIIIDPKGPDPVRYDRDHVVLLSDWSSLHPMTLIAKLKSDAGYFNFQKRTLGDLFSDISSTGLGGAIGDRLRWAGMRMDPTDISDVTGSTYSYLMNGLPPSAGWTGLFKKGEKVRLRFIDAGAMTIFDVRIPGLPMTVVQADGQNVHPVMVDELRIGPGETYDVIVEPKEDKAYAVFAETIDRSGYALGFLAPRAGMKAPLPERRRRPVRGMADMGMAMEGMEMEGMDHGAMKKQNMPATDDMTGMDHGAMKKSSKKKGAMPGMEHGAMKTDGMAGMNHGAMKSGAMAGMDHESMKMGSKAHAGMTMQQKAPPSASPIPGATPVKHGPDHHGPGNSFVPEETRSRLHEPGIGLENTGTRVLVYTDLKALEPGRDERKPGREIELHLTGNMERYMWSIDGKKYSEAKEPIAFRYGERLRLTFVNDTMMEHPMHLHGMWMYLENGTAKALPRKHTIIVKPAERLSVAITADALGKWAFHCHMLLHMELGMFRVVEVAQKKSETGE